MKCEVSQLLGRRGTKTVLRKPLHAELPRRLRAVIVDEELPYPPVSGKRIRILNLVRHLARQHDITLICHANGDSREVHEAQSHLTSLGINTIVVRSSRAAGRATARGLLQPIKMGLNLFSKVPYSVQWHRCAYLQQAMLEHAEKYPVDVWQCEWAPYATNFLATGLKPWIMMAHDIQSSIWQRHHEAEPNWAKRAYIRRQWQRYRQYEGAVFSSADMTITVTEGNARISREVFGARRTKVVENGVDVAYYQQYKSLQRTTSRDPGQVLFLGNLQWRPNLDGARRLLGEIFPRVVAQEPSAKLVVVGRCPPKALRQQCNKMPNVRLHADVADVRPFLHESGIMAVPLRFASGSRLKILEALVTGLPVVSSSVGAEGLQLTPGVHYAQANTAEETAEAIVHWIHNPDAAIVSALAGREVVEEKYDWAMLAARMDAAWQVVAEDNRPC